MPELPEVETVVRIIRPKLEGRTIESANVRWRRTVVTRDFEKCVTGARVVRVWRRAKYIVIDLARGTRPAGAIVGHLRMTGRIHVEPAGFDPDPYSKVELALDDGSTLCFVDVRKFGRFQHVADADVVLAELGPEPLSAAFTPEWLHAALRARRRSLKPLLLDQSFLAGLGNIYVDEALHRSGLHPLARSERVKLDDAVCLFNQIRTVLADAILREGSSFDTFYRTPEGNPGSYQDQFRVYGRDGQACTTCGSTIQRLVVGQRGTHVCPRCQPRNGQRAISPRAASRSRRARAPDPTAARTSPNRA